MPYYPAKPFAASVVELTDGDGYIETDPLQPGWDAQKYFSRYLRARFNLGPEIERINYCCGGDEPNTYLNFGAPDMPGLTSVINAIRSQQGDEAAKEYIRNTLRRDPDEYWCTECKSEYAFLEEVVSPVIKAIASIISYVPGVGTAISFILNTAVALAEGTPIDQAVLNGAKHSLPGQPLSAAAFDAGVAAAKGETAENVAISGLPIDDTSKHYLRTAAKVIRGLAEGQPVTTVTLDAIYNNLPPDGQKAMVLASRAMNGENIGNLAIEQAAMAAKNAGEQEANKFLAQVGYQELMDRVPPEVRAGVQSGIAIATAVRIQQERDSTSIDAVPTVALGRVESAESRATNDEYAALGRNITNDHVRLQLERKSPPTYVHDIAAWQRGFDVGVGASNGLTYNTPELDRIQVSLGNIPAGSGFIAAKELQFALTNAKLNSILEGIDTMSVALGRILSATDRAKFENFALEGRRMATNNEQILAARNLNPDPRFKWGFDIATFVSNGSDQNGDGQDAVRVKLGPFSPGSGPTRGENGSNVAMQGFVTGQALQFAITKALAKGVTAAAGMPSKTAAGALVTEGLSGSGFTSDQKAGAMAAVVADPQARQGAQVAIAKIAAEQNKSFFTKILEFFGLA